MIAVVTGGASGIGRAVTDRLRNAGAMSWCGIWTAGDIDCDISDPQQFLPDRQTVADHGHRPTGRLRRHRGQDCCSSRHPRLAARHRHHNLTGTWLTMRATHGP